MNRQQRVEELQELLQYIMIICSTYDLRVGQLMFCVFGTEDAFNLENLAIKKRIRKWVQGK